MRQRRAIGALTLLGVLCAVGFTVAAARAVAPQPVYSVSQVASGLAHRHGAWVGRSVLVHGTALLLNRDECTGGHAQNGLDLVDRLGTTRRSTLCLQVRNGVISRDEEKVFGLPFIGPALAGYQQITLGRPGTYRVVFPRRLPAFCHQWPAYSGPWPCPAIIPSSARG